MFNLVEKAWAMAPPPQGATERAPSVMATLMQFVPLIILITVSIFCYRFVSPWLKKNPNALRSLWIFSTVLGGAIGLWVFTRVTSVAGRFYSWEPPFREYEAITLVGAGIAIGLLSLGISNLTKKQ